MDSGIESTESSNGSTSDTCSNMADVQSEDIRNYSSHSTSAVSEESLQSYSQDHHFIEPYTINVAPNGRSKYKNTKLDSETNSSSVSKDKSVHSTSNSMPSSEAILPTYLESQKYLTKSSTTFRNSPLKYSSRKLRVHSVEDFNDKSQAMPDDVTLKPEMTFQVPRLPVPDGCCLKLNFPKFETEGSLMHEQATPFEKYATISFANGPLLDISYSQPYTGSLAVLPYESRELQRKFKHYRHRLRQIISTKPKEKKLRIAASLNNVELVDKLLKEGVNSKAVDEKERTALHIAASKGYTDVVRLLLQHGADPNQKDSIGNTALHLAACTSHIETVTRLLKSGTDVKQADNQGYSPLHLAYSRLKLLQSDPSPFSESRKSQVYQIVEMMQEYLKCSGNREEAELLSALTNQLSLSDNSSNGDEDLKQLLNSLQDLTLSKTKKD